MHMSVASVGLNLQLPKNPARNLPAWSFSFSFVFLASTLLPTFPKRKEKVGSPVASTPQRVLLVDTLLMSPLPPVRSRSGQCASRPRMEVSQLILALLS